MSLPARKCQICRTEFEPKEETIFCIDCFDKKSSYQHYCYAIEKLAKSLGMDERFLSEEDIKNMKPLTQDEIKSIKEKIY